MLRETVEANKIIHSVVYKQKRKKMLIFKIEVYSQEWVLYKKNHY